MSNAVNVHEYPNYNDN